MISPDNFQISAISALSHIYEGDDLWEINSSSKYIEYTNQVVVESVLLGMNSVGSFGIGVINIVNTDDDSTKYSTYIRSGGHVHGHYYGI